jgi:Bardet-Biedl syndrome 1 protein
LAHKTGNIASLVFPALQYGTYSREANTLVTISRSGALTFKMTKRTATFKAPDTPSGPPHEQDIPLAVPKKTKLYIEQTQREKDQAMEMHRVFQRDLCKLRLNTARAFVKTIADGGSALASLSGASIRMNASVAGLGPSFKVKLDLTVRFVHCSVCVC